MLGYVLEKDITMCKKWVLRCLKIAEVRNVNIEEEHAEWMLSICGSMLTLQGYYIPRKWFKDMCSLLSEYVYEIMKFKETDNNYEKIINHIQYIEILANSGSDYFIRVRDTL